MEIKREKPTLFSRLFQTYQIKHILYVTFTQQNNLNAPHKKETKFPSKKFIIKNNIFLIRRILFPTSEPNIVIFDISILIHIQHLYTQS